MPMHSTLRRHVLDAIKGAFRRWPGLAGLCTDANSELYDEYLDAREPAPPIGQDNNVQHDVGEEPEDD